MKYEAIKSKAIKLVDTLQADITNGKRQICENYGQKEIRRFDEQHLSGLTYNEQCDIRDILYRVSSIC
jgi:hypothetical protein